MELVMSGDVVSQQADATMIDSVIRQLAAGGTDEFAILSRDDSNYVQTALGPTPGSGFVLEYQVGSIDGHLRCFDTNLSAADIIRIFSLYLQGDDRWLAEHTWEKMDL